jgi:hypothetical protein
MVIAVSTACARGYHPQQSDLKPHAGHRQTACMRYISAPQRSHGVAGSAAGAAASADLMGVMVRTTSGGALPLLPSSGRTGPGMALNYVMACQPKLEAK